MMVVEGDKLMELSKNQMCRLCQGSRAVVKWGSAITAFRGGRGVEESQEELTSSTLSAISL